jgi:hypothetical protein
MCTAANELIAGMTNARARLLRQGVARLFEDTGFGSDFANRFFRHSLIGSLVERRGGGPSYIPSRTFSATMVDLLSAGGAIGVRTWEDVEAGVNTLLQKRRGADGALDPADPLVQTVRVLVQRAGHDLGKLEGEISAWFDAAMERVSAWYKRRTQWVLLAIGIAVAGAANADTVAIVESLSRDSALRSALVAQAEAAASAGSAEAVRADVEQIEALGIPLGWRRDALPQGAGWLQKLAGLLLTAFALTLGAPFWFDLLKKAVNIRSVGRTPEEAEEKRRRAA